MQSRVFSLVLFFLSFGLFAFSSPVETQLEARDMEKRALLVVDVVANLVVNINAIVSGVGIAAVDPAADINSFSTAFDNAANSLKGVGPASLSAADKQTVAKNVATAINNAAASISKAKQTAAVVNASVLLDAKINAFLDILGLIVVNINVLIAPLIVNIKGLLSIHLDLIASVFIDILGIIIIL